MALTRQHGLPDGEVTLLGAHESATGAMTRVAMGGRRLLVDCGKPEGAEAFEWELAPEALDVDAVLLTDGQLAQLGSLPLLIQRGFAGPIFGTPATLSIAKVVLEEALLSDEEMPPGDAARVLSAFEMLVRPLRYEQRGELGGVEFSFHDAGRMLGSASVELWSARSRVICSGHLGRPGSPLFNDYNTDWRPGRAVDLVLLSCTYGDEEHAHGPAELARELERIMLRAFELGGNVVVPAFPLGCAQELFYYLHDLVERRRTPAMPVALDSPAGLRVTNGYDELSELFERESLDAMGRGDEPIDFDELFGICRNETQRVSLMPGPLLIVASNEMCTGGRIVGHLRRLLPLEETTVLLLGHQAGGTPGRTIQRAAKRGGRAWLDHEEVRVRAQVETLGSLSRHADRRDLARWLRAIPDVRRVALHHGEPKAQRGFAAWYR